MASSFDFPSNNQLVDPEGMAQPVWLQVFTRWHRIVTSSIQSGPTADRPTKLLWVGRRFFDTDLGANGKPIWVAQVTPSVIWVDAAGTTV